VTSDPVNESFDALVVPPDGSATDELAAVAGGARLVKAFSTTFATPLRAGDVAGHKLDVLIAGDDEDAKGKVAALARDGGLNPIDVDPLKRARELEAAGLLHLGSRTSSGPASQAPSILSPDGQFIAGRRLNGAAGDLRIRRARR
jgi:predicted dinucleotide-binding enzyme